MSRIKWDQTGEKFYETGVSNGVLYLIDGEGKYSSGVAWNGLTSVSESPEGAEPEKIYADNIVYLILTSTEEYNATINAYTYPDEFADCNGEAEATSGVTLGQQARKSFGFSYQVRKGNDIDYEKFGYEIHLVYGCKASPSDKEHSTINDSPEAVEMSWEIASTPVGVNAKDADGNSFSQVSTIVINSTKFKTEDAKAKLAAFEDIIYGTDGTVSYIALEGAMESGVTYYEKDSDGNYVVTTDTEKQTGKTYYVKTETGATTPRLPLPDEVIELLKIA